MRWQLLQMRTYPLSSQLVSNCLGSGPVKGFAISLGVGVVVSMFTAIIVSRFLLRMLIECNFTNHPFWFGANISPSTSADAFAPKVLKGR